MKSTNSLFSQLPARNPLEAYPLGNGRVGALVFGSFPCERILLNHEHLWSGTQERRESSNDFSKVQTEKRLRALSEARRLIDEGEYQQASTMVEQKLQGNFGESYLPLGELNIRYSLPNADSAAADARGTPLIMSRQLDFSRALLEQKHETSDLEIRSRHWISAVDGLYVISIEASSELDIELCFQSFMQISARQEKSGFSIQGRAPGHVEASYSSAEKPVADKDKGIAFCLNVGIISDGQMRDLRSDVEAASASVCVFHCRKLELRISAETGFSSHDSPLARPAEVRQRCIDALSRSTSLTLTELFERHTGDFRQLYSRFSLEFAETGPGHSAAKRIERYANYSRYLLISSSRSGGLPANLQGIWNWDERPPWCSNWTLNINLPMNYWAAGPWALDECLEPLIEFIHALSVSGEHTARDFFGCRGWTCNHNSDIWVKTRPVEGSPSWAYWPAGGSWMALIALDLYRYCRDDLCNAFGSDFFARMVLPVVQGNVRFVLDWLQTDDRGRRYSSPSTSPENLFYPLPACGAADSAAVTISATASSCGVSSAMDLWLFREVLNAFVNCEAEFSHLLNGEMLQEARLCLENLPLPQVDRHGRLSEWGNDYIEYEPGHRHLSPLVSLYPFDGMFEHRQLVDSGLQLFDHRCEHDFDVLGWSAAWASILASRLGQRQKAWSYLLKLVDQCSYPNLMNSHNLRPENDPAEGPQGIFQIDGNFGGGAAVLEMIVGDFAAVIRLLPALPQELSSGQMKGYRARGSLVLDMSWEHGRVVELILHPFRDQMRTIHSPNAIEFTNGGATCTRADELSDRKPPVHLPDNGAVLQLQLCAGQAVTLVASEG